MGTAEEIFIGAALQFPLYFIVGWWVLPLMAACGLMWRLGGWEHGHKLWRRIGVPGTVCGIAILFGAKWIVLFALPFMVWIAPSYGKESWLFKLIKNDFVTRIITYAWYWTAFTIPYFIGVKLWT